MIKASFVAASAIAVAIAFVLGVLVGYELHPYEECVRQGYVHCAETFQ